MKRGRKKLPENVAPGEHPTPKPAGCDMEPPSHLGDVERAIFSRIAGTLAAMGILTEGDLDALAYLAEVKALAIKAKAKVDASGSTQTTSTGREVASGDYKVWRELKAVEHKLLNDLGLTPASRTRVATVVAEEGDELAAFLAKRSAKPHETTATPVPD